LVIYTRSVFWVCFAGALGALIAFTIWTLFMKGATRLYKYYVEREQYEED